MKKYILLLITVLSLWANAEEVAMYESSQYIPLKPAFTTNFGATGRIAYVKAEISLRVESSEAAAAVTRHSPFIRNNLVLLLSAQKRDNLQTTRAKEALRKSALENIQALMTEMEGEAMVKDLLFTTFVVQN